MQTSWVVFGLFGPFISSGVLGVSGSATMGIGFTVESNDAIDSCSGAE